MANDGAPPPRRWADHQVSADEAGRTVQEILTGPMGISRRMIQKLTRSKGIQLNRRAPFLGKKVRAGDVVSARVAGDEEPGLEPVEMPLAIVHEDADVLLIDKPPFLLVHPTSPEQTRTLSHGVAWHLRSEGLRTKVRPVHRIDRDTSGLVLFAKSQLAHAQLDRQLREGTLQREYLALVHGAVPEDAGAVDAPIGRHPHAPHLRAVREGGEPALTRWRVVERYSDAALLALELETGRTHQVRVHMAHIGHPVIGDRQYGGRAVAGLKRQALHAWRIAFAHPATGEPLRFEAPLPEDLARVQQTVRSH
jgi:RluA family pseudouridine synthase